MGFFGRVFGRASDVPTWAAFFGPEDYAIFETELRRALSARSLPSGNRQLRAGALEVRLGKETASLGLGPMARKCHAIDRALWGGLIDEHLDRALEPSDAALLRLGASLEAARAHLKVQLVPEAMARQDWAEEVNYRTFGAGIKAVLVYDLPTLVSTVPAEDVRRWNRPLAELFDVAKNNVRAEAEAPTVEKVEIESEGFVYHQLFGDSFFVCSHALWLERYPEAQAERGVLVSVPSRHTVLFHPIRDEAAWRALSYMPFMTDRLHAQLPGPVSANIFWLHNGEVADISVTTSDQGFQVAPPLAFVKAMEGLEQG